MRKTNKVRSNNERARICERLSRNNPYYAYDLYKKYQGPSGYEASAKKLSYELKI